jgi:hypothetical protein
MVLIGCLEIEVPQGGYLPPDTDRCRACNAPIAIGTRSAALIRSNPDKYAAVCLTCLDAFTLDNDGGL